MTFPDVPLDVRVELLLSGTWTNVSQWNDHGPVAIARGHPDESTAVSPSTLAMTLTNTDGRFTSKNPTGPYYGSLGRNVPCRVSIPAQTTYARFEVDTVSSVSAPDAARLDITGDTDIRIDLDLSDYQPALLCSKYHSGTNKSWALALNGDGTLFFQFQDSSNVVHSVTSTAPVPFGRIAIRIALQVNNGSGGRTYTFYTAPTIGGTWTQLGSAITVSGTVTVAVSTAPVVIGYVADYATDNPGVDGCLGQVFGFQLLSGIGGTLEASPDFTAQTAGATSFTDGQGNTWTLNGTAEISSRNYRGHFETADWPQHQDPSGKSVTVPVAGGGLLRRLGQRSEAVDSTMRRAILALSGTLAPVAYWPCEDVAGAASIGSAIGGPAMAVNGTASFAADSSFACSAPLPQTGTSVWYGPVPEYTSNGSIIVRFLMNISSALPNGAPVMRVITTGTVFELTMHYYTGGGLGIAGYNASGTVFDTGPFTLNTGPVWVSMELQPGGGGTVNYSLVTLPPGSATGLSTSGSFSGVVGNATACYVNPGAATGTMAIGHITVQSAWESLFNLFQPLDAWAGETAGDRFARLCSEEGIQFRARGDLDATPAMGPQGTQTLTQLLQECADADRGIWTELRQQLGFGYITLGALSNQLAAVTVSYNSDHLEMWSSDPREDDQTTINDVTLTQTSAASTTAGSASYRAYAAPGQPVDGGVLSIQAPPAGAGTYDQSYSVNLNSAGGLPDLAGWILHLGTVNEPRYPGIVLDLTNRDLAALYWQILGMDLGDRLVISNLPLWLPPDPASQLCQQLTEVLWGKQLDITVTGVPESPYETAIFDDAVFGRPDTDGSTLASGVTSAATSLSVATTTAGSPLWTTSAADFPFDIGIGGERMTVTNITGASSPQAFTVTRSVNGVVKAQSAGAGVRLWFPPVMALE